MKLGVFLNTPCEYDGDKYWFPYVSIVDFFAAAAKNFQHLTLCLPVRKIPPERGRGTPLALDSARITVRHLPYYWKEGQMARRFPIVLSAALRQAWRLTREVDIVGCVAPSLVGTSMAWVAHLRNKPVFLLVRGDKRQTLSHIYPNGWRRRLFLSGFKAYELLTQILSDRGVLVFTIGESLAQQYSGIRKQVDILLPLLDDEFFLESLKERKYETAKPLKLLYVGRLSKEKGLADLLQTIRMLRYDMGLDIRLTAVGDGPDEEHFRALVRKLELSDTVHFRGYLPHNETLVKEYLTADIFVLASHTEGVPHSLLEAMGTGLPVVATSVGGIPGLLEDGVNGSLFDPGNVAQCADAVARLGCNPALRSNLAHAAHSVAAGCTFEVQGALLTKKLNETFAQGC